jgi:hypothetical protein
LKWLGFSSALIRGVYIHSLRAIWRAGKTFRMRFIYIWFACVWSLWKARNESRVVEKSNC